LRRPLVRDITLSHAGHRVHVLDQPGRWMSGAQLEALQRDLTHIAGDTCDDALTQRVLDGGRSVLRNRLVVVAYDGLGAPAAFTAMLYLPFAHDGAVEPVIHIGGVHPPGSTSLGPLDGPTLRRALVLPLLNQRRFELAITTVASAVPTTSTDFETVCADDTRRGAHALVVAALAEQIRARLQPAERDATLLVGRTRAFLPALWPSRMRARREVA
jgi:hypothetical protein